jgi:hypothetical protein
MIEKPYIVFLYSMHYTLMMCETKAVLSIVLCLILNMYNRQLFLVYTEKVFGNKITFRAKKVNYGFQYQKTPGLLL